MSWPTYEHPSAPRRFAGPAPLSSAPLSTPAREAVAASALGLGGHFDDVTWARLLATRGWTQEPVGAHPGWVSPPVAGLRLLFACPHLDVTGLDSSTLYVGFRTEESDADELYVVHGNGEGELIFDRLVHADGSFDRAAFLRWLDHDSMADVTMLHAR